MSAVIKFLILIILVLSSYQESHAEDLFLCKNAFIKEPIDQAQIHKLKGDQSYYFKPGNRIVGVFVFHPEKDTEIEFRWISHGQGRRISSSFHRAKIAGPHIEYTAFAWIVLDSTIMDGILGSKYAGNWSLEVYLDKRKAATQSFQVM